MNLKDHLVELIKEVTQGEAEFAKLEKARENFVQNRGDDRAIDDLLVMLEKLVEPLMSEMGLFFDVQPLTISGKIVFTNDHNMEVVIDPRGAMGKYDVKVNPLHAAHDSFDPVEISLDSMKGVVQYIKDEFREELQRGGTYKQPPMGMVGEPEGQMELPLPRENKMRITKSQLQQVIREAIDEEMTYGDDVDTPSLQAQMETAILAAVDALEAGDMKGAMAAFPERLLKQLRPYDGPVGSGPSADMEDYESDYRDPPSKPLDMSGGRKVSRAQRRREAEMMKDYDI